MASVGKNDDGKACECWYNAHPGDASDFAPFFQCISCTKVIYNQNDQVTNRDKSNNTSIFERVQSAEKRQRYDNQPGISLVTCLLDCSCASLT